MAYFGKTFTPATFENAKKYHMSFSQLCSKYNLSEEELEQAIRNVYYKRKADEMIKLFRDQDEKAKKSTKSKKIPTHESVPDIQNTSNTAAVPEDRLEIVHTGVIEVEEITPDNVGEVVAAIEDAMESQTKSTLELLLEKEKTLSETLSVAESELEKLRGLKADISQKLLTLTNEVRELRSTIEQKISEVGQLRSSDSEVNNQISIATLDVEAIKKELNETREAIKVEQPVTITVLTDGWFKFEPETVEIPTKVDVSAEELSAIFSSFVLDPQFETITRKDIRQLIMLDKMIKVLWNDHPNITAQFEDDNLRKAWLSWKQE